MSVSKKPHEPLQFNQPSPYEGVLTEDTYYVEPLLGGVRAAIVFTGSDASVQSEVALPPTQQVLDELVSSDLAENIVLDGEFIGPTFHAFDIMAIEHWRERICEMPLHYRKSILATLLLKGNYERTLFTPTQFISREVEVPRAVRGLVAQGFKGAVLKGIDTPYEFGTTTDWLVVRGE